MNRKFIYKLAVTALVMCTTSSNAQVQNLLNDNITFSNATMNLRRVVDLNNNSLISITSRPGDSNIYVSAQSGSVYSVNPSTGVSTEWFNYNTAVSTAVANAADGYVLSAVSNSDTGLRAVAFHPDFATNGKFYTSAMVTRPSSAAGLNYLGNSTSDNAVAESALAEWTYNHQSGQVDASSYRELFRVRMPVIFHPIKQIGFNPYASQGDEDYGLLYVTHGDGSIFSDTAGGGLNRQDALGKVLRINPLQSAGSPYTTPNNPFVSDPNTLDEIYTLGHRNPHHISFAQDSQGNSYAIVAEAGRDNIEEVNLLQPGGNYGWEDREGTFVHLNGGGYIDGVSALPANEWALNDYIYPVAQYDHDTTAGAGFVGSVIGGGFVIDNSVDPNLNGEYFFADFGSKSGHMYHADFSEMLAAHTQLADNELPSALTQATIYRAMLTLDADGDGVIDRTADNLNTLFDLSRNDVRFGMGPNGEMYITSKGTGELYVVTNSLPVPEPGSLALIGLGSLMLCRRRQTV